MSWLNFNYLVIGIIVGYILNPLLAAVVALFTKVMENTTSACTGDCKQGRNCTCKVS